MRNLFRKLSASIIVFSAVFSINTAQAVELNLEQESAAIEVPNYLKAVISSDRVIEVKKSSIFDASQSFIPDPEAELSYNWDFGDGNKNQGVEVLHAYQEPGYYTIQLTINDGTSTSTATYDVYAYKKLVLLLTDQTDAQERIAINQDFAESNGVYIHVIESFGSNTEFISEEILTKKLRENSNILEKAQDIVIWTKENAGINSLSRYIQNNNEAKSILNQKSILVLENDIESKANRIQKQYDLISPKQVVIAQEGTLNALMTSESDEEFVDMLIERGHNFAIINSESGKLRIWNFMRYFVNILINNGIPDNTIALLLLVPVIATVVAFMRQVVGITTFGVYTPTIITLSFLVIGIYAGLMTLIAAIIVGSLSRPILKKFRMLFIPKMAIVITLVAMTILLLLIASIYLNLFDTAFLSIAIFPMLILSTLVEKFVSAKGDKGLWSAAFLMGETLLVSTVAYVIAGGEINLGIANLKFEFVKDMMLNYPEIILLLLIANLGLGKWTGLRVLEHIRFREVLRHIEE